MRPLIDKLRRWRRSRCSSLRWQMRWSSWSLHFSKEEDDDFDNVFHNTLCVGPIQTRFYSNR